MPFRPELHYMYLYLEKHIEDTHHLNCERGDSKYDEAGILEKIHKYIQDADVIIADCTGRNPNVMYELGMAHEMNKPVILISGDAMEKAPTDIRSFEFIHYNLDDHTAFLNKLDAAINKITKTYDALYETAKNLFYQFREDNNLHIEESSKEDFVRAAAARARIDRLPDSNDEPAVAKSLIHAMASIWDVDMHDLAKKWINDRYAA
jgi:nucleoside 2-deoxyribosyltransferase